MQKIKVSDFLSVLPHQTYFYVQILNSYQKILFIEYLSSVEINIIIEANLRESEMPE